MSGLMEAIRQALGMAERPRPTPIGPEHEAVRDRLIRQQKAVIKALDAQVDAQRTSVDILDHPRRRASDHS